MKREAIFSEDGKHRLILSRSWDDSKPFVMFIGLNPSTANGETDDNTIRRVISIAKQLGYGGLSMMNLFTYVSTDPKLLVQDDNKQSNYTNLQHVAKDCDNNVIFAWGNFKEARERADEVTDMFPYAKALQLNKNGSPKHPLYCKTDIQPVPFNPCPEVLRKTIQVSNG